jgi:hypothetical protein
MVQVAETNANVAAAGPIGLWKPQFNGWNNRNTSAGNKIDHVELGAQGAAGSIDYPLAGVTRDQANAYWDFYFGVTPGGPALPAEDWRQNGTYVRTAAAYVEQNCYGYATDRHYWVNTDGWAAIAQDEWQVHQIDFCKLACVIKLSIEDHIVWFNDCCNNGCGPNGTATPKETLEKFAASGVYKGTFGCTPQTRKIMLGTIYCKKK